MSLYTALRGSFERNRDSASLRVRGNGHYRDISYSELDEIVSEISAGLISLKIAKGDRIAIISENRPEWLYSDLACLAIGAPDVPRGIAASDEELGFVLKDSSPKAAFVEDERQLKRLQGMASLETIIVMDEAFKTGMRERMHGIFSLNDIISRGRRELAQDPSMVADRAATVSDDDLATIIYTSGTSGMPKGVMLSHGNLLHNTRAVPEVLHLGAGERIIAVLPPWHLFERATEYVGLAIGASIAYSSARTVKADFADAKPTFMASVPRIWETVYEAVERTMQKGSPMKKRLYDLFMGIGREYIRAHDLATGNYAEFTFSDQAYRAAFMPGAWLKAEALRPLYSLGDRLVYSKIRAQTGGSLRGAVSGGAALPRHVDEFFRIIGMPILEGFGMTETGPGVTFRTFENNVPFTAGRLLPGVDMMVVDDSGRTLASGHEGEIMVSGANVMQGYWNNPAETRATLETIGDTVWIHTGDLGRVDAHGNLQITGRKKNLIKLQNGEYVAPEPIEEKLRESQLIRYAVCAGQDERFIGVLVVPNFYNLIEQYMKMRGITEGPVASLLTLDEAVLHARVRQQRSVVRGILDDPEVVALYQAEIKRLGDEMPAFRTYGNSKMIALLAEPFEVGAELTHTLKVKRNEVYREHRDAITALYRR